MAKLDVERLGAVSDEADGPDLSAAHQELEVALGAIFGIPDKIDISQAIFSNPDVSSDVTATGKIFMLRYKTDSVVSDGKSGSGIEFYDGAERKRLTFVNSHVAIWREVTSNPETWAEVIDFEFEPDVAPTLGGDEPLTDVDNMVAAYGGSSGAGLVLAVGTHGKFTLVPNEVATTGAEEFTVLTDVSDKFSTFLSYNFNPNTWGQGFKISADGSLLEPTDISSPDDDAFVAYAEVANGVSLGQVGILGNGDWTVIQNWNLDPNSSPSATVVEGAGLPRAAFALLKGVYRVSFQYAQTVVSTTGGPISFSIGALRGHLWPPVSLSRRAVQHQYFNGESEDPMDDWVWTDQFSYHPKMDMGPFYVVVPDGDPVGLVGFRMGVARGAVAVRPSVCITRIH